MSSVDASSVVSEQRLTTAGAASLFYALACDETAGQRPARLTEPALATWECFLGRLTATDLVALAFEAAAVLHRLPFDTAAIGAPLDRARLPACLAEGWLDAVARLQTGESCADYVAAQVPRLGLPTRMTLSELHVVAPRQNVLELPDAGGQLVHHLVSNQSDCLTVGGLG